MATDLAARLEWRESDQRDQEVAQEICERHQYGGRHFERGQYVAILDGEVVAVAESAEQALQALRDRAPNRWQGLVCLVADPEPDVIR